MGNNKLMGTLRKEKANLLHHILKTASLTKKKPQINYIIEEKMAFCLEHVIIRAAVLCSAVMSIFVRNFRRQRRELEL